ncbi:hypothetical protein HYV72_00325, partial [Candidatus Uhrbacteria bacterium]|nr:hypothetical protein [Candidatus Uhrbacteria bacterium]
MMRVLFIALFFMWVWISQWGVSLFAPVPLDHLPVLLIPALFALLQLRWWGVGIGFGLQGMFADVASVAVGPMVLLGLMIGFGLYVIVHEFVPHTSRYVTALVGVVTGMLWIFVTGAWSVVEGMITARTLLIEALLNGLGLMALLLVFSTIFPYLARRIQQYVRID